MNLHLHLRYSQGALSASKKPLKGLYKSKDLDLQKLVSTRQKTYFLVRIIAFVESVTDKKLGIQPAQVMMKDAGLWMCALVFSDFFAFVRTSIIDLPRFVVLAVDVGIFIRIGLIYLIHTHFFFFFFFFFLCVCVSDLHPHSFALPFSHPSPWLNPQFSRDICLMVF